jgi:TRAP-type C4-dicarboxylate transport system permease small subunit
LLDDKVALRAMTRALARGKAMNGLLKVTRWVEEWLPAALMAVITLVVVSDVVGRYVFSRPLNWAGELATLLFIWLVFLAAPAALKRGLHVNVDLFVVNLSGRVRSAIALGVYACALGAFIVIGYLGVSYAAQAGTHRLHTLDLPFTWAVVAIPICAVLMSVHLVRFIGFCAEGLKTGVLDLRQEGFGGTGCLLNEFEDESESDKLKGDAKEKTPAC